MLPRYKRGPPGRSMPFHIKDPAALDAKRQKIIAEGAQNLQIITVCGLEQFCTNSLLFIMDADNIRSDPSPRCLSLD
jgi:hypothetical protein